MMHVGKANGVTVMVDVGGAPGVTLHEYTVSYHEGLRCWQTSSAMFPSLNMPADAGVPNVLNELIRKEVA